MKKTIALLSLCIGLNSLIWSQSTCSPVITYNNNIDLCTGSGDLVLTVNTGIPSGCQHTDPNNPYTWKSPNNNSQVTSSNQVTYSSPIAGEYTVEISLTGGASCPCNGIHTSNIIEVNNVPPAPSVTSSQTSCGNAVTLSATAQTNDPGYFKWYNSSGDLIFSGNNFNTGPVTQTVTYDVTYFSGGCESPSSSVTVLYNPLSSPLILNSNVNDTVSINCSNTITLQGAPTGSGAGVIQWYDDINLNNILHIGNQFQTPVLETSVTYYAATFNNGCISPPQRVVVQVVQTPKPIVSDVESCKGGEVILSANYGQGGIGQGTFEWYRNNVLVNTGSQFVLTKNYTDNPGTYNFQVRERNNQCLSDSAQQVVTVHELPNIYTDTNFIRVCERESFQLSAFSDQGIAINTIWYGPSGDTISLDNAFTVNNSSRAIHDGTYFVEGNDNNGCIAVASVIVDVVSGPNVGLVPRDTIEDGTFIQLSASGGDEYRWEYVDSLSRLNIPNPYFYPKPLLTSQPKEYALVVNVTDYDNQCTAIDSSFIVVTPKEVNDKEPLVKVYDVITPDGNGKNDFLEIEYLYNLGSEYKIYVFNKRNQVIFQFDSNSSGEYAGDNRWDGKYYDNRAVPTGAYRYVIEHSSGTISGLLTVLNNEE